MKTECQRFQDLLLGGLDESLAPADQARLDAHLSECPTCLDAMRDHVVLRSLLREVGRPAVDPSPPLPEDLVARCTQAMKAARSGRAEPGEGRTTRTA
jgi:predicted anti-sigma-YlaC factor YlaD